MLQAGEMTSLRGRYINLRNSEDRRKKLEGNLKDLGILNYYSRYEAMEGKDDIAKEAGLRNGELGLWLSWLDLLQKEIENEEKYEYLHIIEDDVIIGRHFAKLIQNQLNINATFDILMTDMYVNPSIYLGIKDEYKTMARNETIGIKRNFYSGCTSSCIIQKKNLKKVRHELMEIFYKKGKKIPIDNTLHSLRTAQKLEISTTIPFLTGIRLEDIADSTIQKSQQTEAVTISRSLCNILRRELSLVRSPEDRDEKVFSYIQQLRSIHKSQKDSALNEENITDLLTRYAHEKEMLRYEYREQLIGEPGNKQRQND